MLVLSHEWTRENYHWRPQLGTWKISDSEGHSCILKKRIMFCEIRGWQESCWNIMNFGQMKRYDAHTLSEYTSRFWEDLAAGQNFWWAMLVHRGIKVDPGVLLVQQVRPQGIQIEVIPVPRPLSLRLSRRSGYRWQTNLLFTALLPKRKVVRLFPRVGWLPTCCSFLWVNSSHYKTLDSLHRATRSQNILARELTKLYEEMLVGTADELH